MWKQVSIIVLLSILVVMGAEYVSAGMHGLATLHDHVLNGLSLIFSGSQIATLIQRVLGIVILPAAAAILVALFAKFTKFGSKDCALRMMWVVWLLLVATLTTMSAIPPTVVA
ncbi:MAG: hypothetical protein DHS20C10_11760 [marine bacterium B5-7]|nr:MAG: hypothetical protein DHS20C10_11760 [marine bacterium B5-7]